MFHHNNKVFFVHKCKCSLFGRFYIAVQVPWQVYRWRKASNVLGSLRDLTNTYDYIQNKIAKKMLCICKIFSLKIGKITNYIIFLICNF